MKKLALIFVFGMLLFSCEKKEAEVVDRTTDSVPCSTDSKSGKGDFEMYEMSEMAALMEQMYVDNERLKERIINGDTIGKFPHLKMEVIDNTKLTSNIIYVVKYV